MCCILLSHLFPLSLAGRLDLHNMRLLPIFRLLETDSGNGSLHLVRNTLWLHIFWWLQCSVNLGWVDSWHNILVIVSWQKMKGDWPLLIGMEWNISYLSDIHYLVHWSLTICGLFFQWCKYEVPTNTICKFTFTIYRLLMFS